MNNDYLDQIAIVKREKDIELNRQMQEFRMEKEAILTKATKEEEQSKIDFKAEVAKQEMEKNNVREKQVNKRLEIQKRLEDNSEKWAKEKSQLQSRIADLEEKTTKESAELEAAT